MVSSTRAATATGSLQEERAQVAAAASRVVERRLYELVPRMSRLQAGSWAGTAPLGMAGKMRAIHPYIQAMLVPVQPGKHLNTHCSFLCKRVRQAIGRKQDHAVLRAGGCGDTGVRHRRHRCLHIGLPIVLL